MTMTPERFRELLDAGTANGPPDRPAAYDVAAGRSRLRRRRIGAVSVLTVAIVAGGAALATGAVTDDRGLEPVHPAPAPGSVEIPVAPEAWGEEQLLRVCEPELDSVHWDGTERVVASGRTGYQGILAIASEDGRYWAECTLAYDDPEALPELTAYDAYGPSQRGVELEWGTGCGAHKLTYTTYASDPCEFYSVASVDRLPPDVAAVRYELSDGGEVTVPTHEGYVVLNLLRPLPPGVSIAEDGRLTGFKDGPVAGITYLDASGASLPKEDYPSMKSPL